ncbi:hypothetical protein KSF73_00235 [Burkholderiaceae bacterium DAT-1]|nr:hypothetical protein [Burkholderiaceae bacterium DAT-1]
MKKMNVFAKVLSACVLLHLTIFVACPLFIKGWAGFSLLMINFYPAYLMAKFIPGLIDGQHFHWPTMAGQLLCCAFWGILYAGSAKLIATAVCKRHEQPAC